MLSTITAWKVSKYGVFSGPYFPAFSLNTERYFVFSFSVFSLNAVKYGPEKTSYLDTFHAVYFIVFINHLLCFYISVFRLSFKQPRMCVLNITVWREVFEKFLRTKLFFVKFQTLSLQAFSFQSSLIPNTQTRHFLWSPIQKTLKFRKGDNSSRWSLYTDLEVAVQNILLNRLS